MNIKVNGSCLCGKIKFVLLGPFDQFHLCHCSRCRKSTGSAHASIIFAKPENIQWDSGSEFIKRFDLPEAKRFAKCFCTGNAVQLFHIRQEMASFLLFLLGCWKTIQ